MKRMTTNNLNLHHHAYCLIGSDSVRAELLSSLEKEHGILAQGNPDFFDRSYETFTIDNAREVKAVHETRPMSDAGKKIFILKMNGITIEAQNALLKLLEEPSEYSHFFLIIPSAHLLLATVKSRLLFMHGQTAKVKGKKEVTSLPNDGDDEIEKSAETFINSSSAKRLEQIKKLLDEISKEKRPKHDAIDFLNAIQASVYDKKGAVEGKKALESTMVATKYMYDRAPSLKMLLEYVALNI